MALPQSATLDGLPKRFVTAMRTLFNLLDDQNTGCVRYSDLKQWWQDDGAKGLPKGVLESLQKVTPPNGLLTFERFCAGLKICLLRNQTEANKAIPTTEGRQPLMKRPPSAPILDEPEATQKGSWVNTATVRPNNALASRTSSMPQLLPEHRDKYELQSDIRSYPPLLMPYGVTNTGAPMCGPPKPPRSAPCLERAVTVERNIDRSEIRNALHNWQKGVINQDSDLNTAFLRGRGPGDGKSSGFVEPNVPTGKKSAMRKREPRRHTLQNGIDYNMLKRIKHIEQEKDMLLQGLAAVERTREWYLKQIAIVQEKMKYLGRTGGHVEPWSEAHADRLELQKARVFEVNRHLTALTESWERGGLPLHINLAVHPLTSSEITRVKNQNRLLTKEVGEKSQRISALEQEKSALLRELYQARVRLNACNDVKLHERGGFV